MTRPRPLYLALLIALACLLTQGMSAAQTDAGQATQQPAAEPNPQTEPQTDNTTDQAEPAPQPAPGLTVRDLFVVQIDSYGEVANDPSYIETTLFPPIKHQHRTKRKNEGNQYEYEPMPLGLVTFEGGFQKPTRVRMDLPEVDSFFHAHWPEDARKGPQVIDWIDVHEAGGEQQAMPITLDRNWLEPLRGAEDRLWLRTRNQYLKERFLLYDASFPYPARLALAIDGDTYRLTKREPEADTPDLAIVLHKQADGWAADAKAGPWADDQPVIADKPTTATTHPDIEAALEPLTKLLTERGYNAAEIELAIGMIAGAGVDKSAMSLIYVLSEEELAKHVLIRFKPEPDQLIRTGIVVATSADPDLGTRIDRLIVELGSEDWPTRERAQVALENIGLAAIRKVQEVREHKDPEIAFRARQILKTYDMRREMKK